MLLCRGVRDGCGPVHIVIGDGGNREGLAEVYDEPQPDWSAYREASYGSGTLDLLNTTHALWRWHRNQDSQAIVSDEVGPIFLLATEPVLRVPTHLCSTLDQCTTLSQPCHQASLRGSGIG